MYLIFFHNLVRVGLPLYFQSLLDKGGWLHRNFTILITTNYQIPPLTRQIALPRLISPPDETITADSNNLKRPTTASILIFDQDLPSKPVTNSCLSCLATYRYLSTDLGSRPVPLLSLSGPGETISEVRISRNPSQSSIPMHLGYGATTYTSSLSHLAHCKTSSLVRIGAQVAVHEVLVDGVGLGDVLPLLSPLHSDHSLSMVVSSPGKCSRLYFSEIFGGKG